MSHETLRSAWGNEFIRNLKVLGLTVLTIIVMFAGHWYSEGSLVLLSEAAHAVADSAGILMSLLALILVRRWRMNEKKAQTFAYYSLVALLIATIVGVAAGALYRIINPPEIHGLPVIIAAAIGCVLDYSAHRVLHGAHHHDKHRAHRALNFHYLGDIAIDGGGVLSGIIILLWGWMPADPLTSFAAALIMSVITFQLITDPDGKKTVGCTKHTHAENDDREH